MIATERLLLRPWRNDDAGTLAALLADPLAMADTGGPVDRAASDRKLAAFQDAHLRHGLGKWLVTHCDAVVGYCGVMPVGADHVLGAHYEIGWRLRPCCWGRGFASEAARAALHHALHDIGLAEVFSYTAADNYRSRAVMDRLGLRRDPLRDFTMFYDGVGDWHGLVWVADRFWPGSGSHAPPQLNRPAACPSAR